VSRCVRRREYCGYIGDDRTRRGHQRAVTSAAVMAVVMVFSLLGGCVLRNQGRPAPIASPRVSCMQLSPDGTLLALDAHWESDRRASASASGWRDSVWVMDRRTGKIVFDPRGHTLFSQRCAVRLLGWRDDRTLLFAYNPLEDSTANNAQLYSISIGAAGNNKLERLRAFPNSLFALCLSNDKRYIWGEEEPGKLSGASYLYRVKIERGETKRIAVLPQPVALAGEIFNAGRTVLWILVRSYTLSEAKLCARLYTLDLDSAVLTPISKWLGNVTWADGAPEAGKVAAIEITDGKTLLHTWNIAEGSHLVRTIPEGFSRLQWSQGGAMLLVQDSQFRDIGLLIGDPQERMSPCHSMPWITAATWARDQKTILVAAQAGVYCYDIDQGQTQPLWSFPTEIPRIPIEAE